MSVEFAGIAATAPHSETEIAAQQADPVQPGYLAELARAHEEAGFGRVLVAHSSASPGGFTVADQVLSRTQQRGVLLAHRPRFVAPTYAARKFAALDAFHPGRVAVHVPTTRLTRPGGNSTALVGTAQQVAGALMAYRRVGVDGDTALIRGFDPLDDWVEWGRDLVPLLREEAARTPVGTPGAAEGALSA